MTEPPEPDFRILDQRIEMALRELAPPEDPRSEIEENGGGGHTGGMDDRWAQSVESRLGALDEKIDRGFLAFSQKVDRQFIMTWSEIFALGVLGVGGFAWMIDILLDIQRDLGEIAGALPTLSDQLATKGVDAP